MKTTRSFLLLLMLLATSGLNAQKEEDKYAALVSEVRNEVWSLNLPDFKNMTNGVPQGGAMRAALFAFSRYPCRTQPSGGNPENQVGLVGNGIDQTTDNLPQHLPPNGIHQQPKCTGRDVTVQLPFPGKRTLHPQ